MSTSHESNRPSAEMLARFVRGRTTPAEEVLIRAWEEAAPEHRVEVRAVRRILELSRRLPDSIGVGAAPTGPEILGRLRDRTTARNVPPSSTKRRRRSGFPSAWIVAAAAVIAVAFAVVRAIGPSDGGIGFGAEAFVTGPSEIATITLRDGSVVRLGPSSRLDLEPSRTERRASLDGRAYFAVASHERLPFVVRTSGGDVVRVIGTRFDLGARGNDLQLIVVEGRVAVSARGSGAELRAGQMRRVVNGTALPVVDVPDTFELTDWVGRFLAFQSTPVRDAAREIERQYGTRIVVTDSTLARRTITAWFSDWSQEDVMFAFCAVAEARCETTDSVITVEPLDSLSSSR